MNFIVDNSIFESKVAKLWLLGILIMTRSVFVVFLLFEKHQHKKISKSLHQQSIKDLHANV